MKVALTHDYLREYGGAERVLEVIHEMFPDAPLYTAYYNPKTLGINAKHFANWDIRTSWLQHFPFANKVLSPFRIFAPKIFEGFDLSSYDLVISSSSAVYFAKAVITKPKTLHISYIHTPPRYLYGYTTAYDFKKNQFIKFAAAILNHFLRMWDYEVTQRPNILVANSKNIAARIKKFYRRNSVVIYPPVELEQFDGVVREIGDYYLCLGRLDRGKRLDIIIEACNKLKLPLKIAGTGKEYENLKALAGNTIEFLGSVNDEKRVELLAHANALILASEDEDFGITPVEAQAAGTPCIALRAGGYKETILEGKTGEFFEEATANSLVKVLEKFDPKNYDEKDCKENARRFSKEEFKKQFQNLIRDNLNQSP
jgi:glycosyltransferase involved in cell wall biosynthesis